MPSSLTTNSLILEYIALAACFAHCCMLLIVDDIPIES